MHHFATLLDRSYLARGLALQRSIARHADDVTLWVLCADDDVARALGRLAPIGVRTLDPRAVLGSDLEDIRQGRSRREYFFAAKAYLVRYMLTVERVHHVTLIDGDMFVLSDPRPMLDEIADASVALTAHRSGDARFEDRFGRFNAGFVHFRGDARGIDAAHWWVDRCAEATPDYPVDGRFAEQKYLDALATESGTVVIDHPGVNAAPWNLARAEVRDAAGTLLVDGRPLVCFHFQGAERWRRGVYAFRAGASPRDPVLRARLHRPYAEAWERGVADAAGAGIAPTSPEPWGRTRPRPPWWRAARLVGHRAAAVASGRVLVHRS